ncbi:guanylate kinase [uncultured Desulfovibrio sp.]|uniref:Guanylate kinase n=1 Tax=Candidatus Desulfovibrio intestinavium TaxID=2838534 RepID=A0A9D2HN37_9BACT|nr:guanylate kinase [uncultured Desulfovibrio sp.]HJA79721.1 guanylate kinase [Candidatus Desulfovibrio intestinavium]
MRRHGIALVISAPSGAGKTTLIGRLREEFPHFGYSISCTTRAPRDGERDGADYHFLTRARFEELRESGHFAEWAEVHGNLYGTPLAPVREMLRQGQDVLFDIDVQGARQLKQSLGEAVFVFILPPSLAELERRLRGRGLDSEETIARRLRNARAELREAAWYDYLVVNDDVDTAHDHLRAAYVAATLRPLCRPDLLRALEQGALDAAAV